MLQSVGAVCKMWNVVCVKMCCLVYPVFVFEGNEGMQLLNMHLDAFAELLNVDFDVFLELHI